MLAQQYCNECKTSFEELSKIIQKVLVSRKELVAYDRKHRDIEPPKQTPLLKEPVSIFFVFRFRSIIIKPCSIADIGYKQFQYSLLWLLVCSHRTLPYSPTSSRYDTFDPRNVV